MKRYLSLGILLAACQCSAFGQSTCYGLMYPVNGGSPTLNPSSVSPPSGTKIGTSFSVTANWQFTTDMNDGGTVSYGSCSGTPSLTVQSTGQEGGGNGCMPAFGLETYGFNQSQTSTSIVGYANAWDQPGYQDSSGGCHPRISIR